MAKIKRPELAASRALSGRADVEAPWAGVPDGMVTHDQFSAADFTVGSEPLDA